MANNLIISGIISTKYMKTIPSQFGKGNLYNLTLIVQAYVGKGKGYNGTDYDSEFHSLSINDENLYGKQLVDKQKVMVIGELRKYKTKQANGQEGSTTYIKASRIFALSELPEAQKQFTPQQNGVAMMDFDIVQDPKPSRQQTQDDSILWED